MVVVDEEVVAVFVAVVVVPVVVVAVDDPCVVLVDAVLVGMVIEGVAMDCVNESAWSEGAIPGGSGRIGFIAPPNMLLVSMKGCEDELPGMLLGIGVEIALNGVV